MASSETDRELEEQLKEAGNSLLNPPSAIDELLKIIDDADNLLANVVQGPSISMQDALLPLMKALISNELLRHSDVDVKLSITSCLTEMTRITAPDPPYDDERMKEIFQLIVAAFENLSHVSGLRYEKAVSILHITAKVRSSLLMLDLECKALILEMFQHFLKINQSNLPDAVFSAMEYIMTMVLDESEKVPLDLLKILLSSVKKENLTVSSISWKLGEKVIENCSAKLKPYLVKEVKSMGIALDDYAQIVASVCLNGSDALKNDNGNSCEKDLVNENKLVKRTSNEASDSHVTEGHTPSAVCPKDTCKTVADLTRDESNAGHKSSKTLQRCHLIKHSKGVESRDSAQLDNSFSHTAVKSEAEPNSAPKKRGLKPNSLQNSKEGHDHAKPNRSCSLKAVKSESETDLCPKKRGRKPNSLMNPEEGYDHSWISSGRRTEKPAGSSKPNYKGSPTSPAKALVHGKAALRLMLPNLSEPPNSGRKTEEDRGASPYLKNNRLGGTKHKRGRPKKQVGADLVANSSYLTAMLRAVSSAQVGERTPEAENSTLRKEFDGTNKTEEKAGGYPKGARLAEKSNEESTLASAQVVTDKESTVPDENPQQQSDLKLRTVSTNDQSSIRTGSKKRKRNANSGKESTEASGTKKISKSATKISEDNQGTPSLVLKRNRTIEKEEACQMPDLGERLVGSRINIWWPQDKVFYGGVVASYDPAKKKHSILYSDGDEEKLNLKKQRWQLLDDVLLDVPMENQPNPEASSDTPKKRKQKANSESSEQANAGLSSKRISRSGVSVGISTVECMKSGSKSADCDTVVEPIVIDEDVNDQSKENGGLKVDCPISAGELEADTNTGIESAQTQIKPETTLSKGENPKVVTEASGGECAKELTELSNGEKDAILPIT